MSSEKVSNNLRQKRVLAQLTQEELARLTGVTRQTIIAIESGKYAPSLPLAFKIAQTFSVSIEAVFQYENKDS